MKIDLLSADQVEKIKQTFKKKFGVTGYAISGVTGKNINQLLQAIAEKVLASKKAWRDKNKQKQKTKQLNLYTC